MKIVVCGLSISSAWGNGHAMLLRGLFRALHKQRHEVHFFERDTPYYANHRDATSFPFACLHLYSDWNDIHRTVSSVLQFADVAMLTSYCADGLNAYDLIASSRVPRKVFYDMDTPVTLTRLERGESVEYVPPEGLGAFDIVLSYTGGDALFQLRERLNARRVAPLYGWVDPEVHRPINPVPEYSADLSYLGTYAADRQLALQELFLSPAKQLRDKQFLVGGPMYPNAEEWPRNVAYMPHVPPAEHGKFYCSSRLTLNLTRGTMAAMGYCPSGRLFEAAACGTPMLSDWWTGLDSFFQPNEEILITNTPEDTVAAITQLPARLKEIGARARQRALDCHTAQIRAREFMNLIEDVSIIDATTKQGMYAYEGV